MSPRTFQEKICEIQLTGKYKPMKIVPTEARTVFPKKLGEQAMFLLHLLGSVTYT